MGQKNITEETIQEAVTEAIKVTENEKVLTRSNTTTVQLPSNGLLNKNITEITLRKMSVREMKTLHTSSDPNFLTTLLLGCIVKPTKIVVDDLHPNDIIYLLFVLRYISSPKDIVQESVCPTCRKAVEVPVKVPELSVNYFSGEMNDFEVTLPECGDKITFRLLSEGEITEKEKLAKRKAKQQELSEDDTYWYILFTRTAHWLVCKNDVEFENFKEKSEFLENLSAYDFETLRLAYSNEVEKFGLNRKFIATCSNCKDEIEVEAYIAPDFFRLV